VPLNGPRRSGNKSADIQRVARVAGLILHDAEERYYGVVRGIFNKSDTRLQ